MENSEESSDQEKKKTCHRLCVRFANKTSMQGVPNINTARLWYSKVLWAFLLLAAVGVMVFHLYYLCDQYFSWPKITKISLGFDNLVLPAITVCNINPIKVSQLYLGSPRLQSLVDRVNPKNLDLTLERKKRFVDELLDLNATEYDSYDYSDYYDTMDEFIGEDDEVSLIEDWFTTLYMETDRYTRIDMGHQIEDMLVKCVFNGKVCSADNFTVYNTPEYGNCFTIQSDKFVSKRSGPNAGLQLILFMENSEYLSGITQGHGARISIHNKNEIPFPMDNGLFVSTNADNDIAIRLVDINRRGFPFGKCESGESFKNTYKKEYTRQACAAFFTLTTMIKECNCYDESSADTLLEKDLNSKTCSTKAEDKCLSRVYRLLDQKKIKPSCESPCREKQYVKTVSSIKWPTRQYSAILLKKVCSMMDSCDVLRTYTPLDFADNLVKINIYYEDLNYEEIQETPEIEIAQFLSDVGGAVGLWIGLSILSMFEVVQLLIELCQFANYKCINSNTSPKQNTKRRNVDKVKSHDRSPDQVASVFHRQNFNQDLTAYPHIKNGTSVPSWKYDQPMVKNVEKDFNRYSGRTRYTDGNDYQDIGEYYMYKGRQNVV